jgi:glycosyltransferase involved in cell wall biosynthesis
MCSKCEAFGRVTIEAMKIGIPVIGSNTCGTVELIEHERSGLLYEQGNPSGLANEVIKLIKYPELKERIIKEAKNHAEDLVSEKHILNFFENEL